jgi:nucleoside-diphosphate-sugar epimerase
VKVFVAGATGVLGRRTVQRLVAGGHSVVGLSRSPANMEWLRKNGAEPHQGDLFDPAQVKAASEGCDAVLHLATAIPDKIRTPPRDWALNDRIRREGTRNLVEAALANRAKVYVQQSITFIYGDRGGGWVDEETPVSDGGQPRLASTLDMERIAAEATGRGLPAINLRCGTFYCWDSSQTQVIFRMVKRGLFPVVGDGAAYWNLIHVDDAAAAFVKAVENHSGNAGRTFNVCDDEPVTFRALADFVAEVLGARRPRSIPPFLARLALGSETVRFFRASARVRNVRARERLEWRPQFPTYREGIRAEAEKWLRAG